MGVGVVFSPYIESPLFYASEDFGKSLAGIVR